MTAKPNVENEPSRKVGWYKRLFAYLMARQSSQYNDMVGDRKRQLLSQLHGDVLEIGAGTAPNLAFYAKDIRWIGVEPNPAMFTYVRQEAQRVGIQVELREGKSEQLPVEDSSMDAVVSTLVLCSVHDPQKALAEILRVLKPGGQFVFIEHVAAPANTRLRGIQRFVKPLWGACSDGCHPDRETWATIENAGFRRVDIDHFHVDAPIVGPHISGIAIK